MTPVRPTTVQPAPPSAPSVASARAAFFQALGGAGETAPVAPAPSVVAVATTAGAPRRAAEPAPETGRLPRPGSLLDIRV